MDIILIIHFIIIWLIVYLIMHKVYPYKSKRFLLAETLVATIIMKILVFMLGI